MKKIIPILIIAILCMSATVSYAVDVSDLKDIENYNAPGVSKAGEIAGNILQIIEIIGVAVAIIMLIFVAIKYMMAAASEKAEVKKYLIPYFVGAIFVFGSMGIVELLKNFANQTLNQ